MTIGQIKGFLGAIARRTALQQAMQLSTTALGSQGSGKDIKKTLKVYTDSAS